MKIIISIPKGQTLDRLQHLKRYIESKDLNDISNVNIDRKPAKPGEMGDGGFLSSVSAIISAATGPLTELVKCLQVYIQSFHTEIEITVDNKTVKISGKNPEEAKELVEEILKSIQ